MRFALILCVGLAWTAFFRETLSNSFFEFPLDEGIIDSLFKLDNIFNINILHLRVDLLDLFLSLSLDLLLPEPDLLLKSLFLISLLLVCLLQDCFACRIAIELAQKVLDLLLKVFVVFGSS